MTMKTVVNVSCDGENCDHVRASDSNHWFIGLVDGKGILITSCRERLPVELKDIIVKDFCGQECAVKWVSKMMQEIHND
jgi:hypothetical protein